MTPDRRFASALALLRSYEPSFRRTARRYSLCPDDAEDAYQRALEILLTKAPACARPRLAAWMHTVTKHEALAVRRSRERILGAARRPEPDAPDPLEAVASDRADPADAAERRERVAFSADALAALKPQERRALALKAEGFSYAEIQEITGWTYTKVNRCMAEGRKRFLEVYSALHGA